MSHVFVLFGMVNPDRCFREPQVTRAVNVSATIALLREAFDMGLTPVYMSTDYVFDGTRGYRTEDETVSPTTSYGRQKAEVEAWLAEQQLPWLVCRSSKIVSGETDTHSVLGQWALDIRAGRAMRCAVDQVFSPALADDIAHAMVTLADSGQTGIFHVAGTPAYSRYQLAALLADHIRSIDPEVAIDLTACNLAEIPFAEPRPLDTSLSVEKLLKATGLRFTTMNALCLAVAQQQFG